jgi:hypothetical protein
MSINKFKPGADQAQIWGDNGGMIVVKAGSREEADKVVHPVRE